MRTITFIKDYGSVRTGHRKGTVLECEKDFGHCMVSTGMAVWSRGVRVGSAPPPPPPIEHAQPEAEIEDDGPTDTDTE